MRKLGKQKNLHAKRIGKIEEERAHEGERTPNSSRLVNHGERITECEGEFKGHAFDV